MIKGHEIFRLPDEGKKHELKVEVNWEPKNKKINDCKLLRLIFPNGDIMLLKKEHLNAMLFALGTAAEQMQLIPKVERRSRWYETVVSVKAKKDIKAGQEVVFPIKLSLPTFEQEVIAEAKADALKSQSPFGV